jgi:hypothetical protein
LATAIQGSWNAIPGVSYPSYPGSFNTIFANLARKVLKGVVLQQAPTLSPAVQCLLRNKEVMPGSPAQSFYEFNAVPLNPSNPLTKTDYTYSFSLTPSQPSNVVPARCNDAKYITTMSVTRGELNLLVDNPNTFFEEITVRLAQLYQNVIQQLSNILVGYTTATDFSDFYGLGNVIDDTTQTGVSTFESINRGTYPWFCGQVLNPNTFTINSAAIPVYQQIVASQIWFDKKVNGMVPPFRFGFCNHATLGYIMFSLTKDTNNNSIERYLNLDAGREYDIRYIRVGNVLLFADPLIPAGQIFFFHPGDVRLVLNRDDAFVSKIIDLTFTNFFEAQGIVLLIGGQLICERPMATMRLINLPTMGGM